MPDFELLVIGGGPAGMSAARGYRDAEGAGRVAIVTDEQRMPYRRPPLTKELLRGEIQEDELPLESERWLHDHQVSLISGRVIALDHVGHAALLVGGRRLTYASCVIATGAEPRRLPVPGGDDPAVRVLRSLDQFREIQARLTPASEVVVIGSGFIGCEIAASLQLRGTSVSLVTDEAVPNKARLGERAGTEIARWLAKAGVTLEFGAPVESIGRDGERLRVATGNTTLEGTLVVMATGVSPRGELMADAVELAGGAIPADQSMRTELPDVLAAGDVALAYNAQARRHLHVEHWGDALAQGEIAGRTAAGLESSWRHVPGFWSAIGRRTLKYSAWGDGYDDSRFDSREDGSFIATYGREGKCVGVLAHDADDEYARAQRMIEAGAPW